MTSDDQILTTLDRWLEKEVAPYVHEMEQRDEYPREWVEQIREFGLFGAKIPEQYGGLGMSASLYAQVVERISRVWISLSGVFNSHLMMAEQISRYGSEELRSSILPLCATGELRGGLALTEPGCGSDLQAITTRAQLQPDGSYTITGAKTWITNALYGNCLGVLVKTDTEIRPRHLGMSMFFVLKSDGYAVGKKLGKLGYRGIDTTEVFFDDVRVPASQLIGEVGRGFKQTVGALELGRINVAARGVGVADAALQAALEYSRVRETMGKPIGQHQAVQMRLADMACRVASSRALVAIAAAAFDRGERCDLEAGMAKLTATEAALANATSSMMIHGAYGYSTEVDVERVFRDAPTLSIGEGPNDIQRVLIARRLLEG